MIVTVLLYMSRYLLLSALFLCAHASHAGLITIDFCRDIPTKGGPHIQGVFIENQNIPAMGFVEMTIRGHESRERGNRHAPSNPISATNRLNYAPAYILGPGYSGFPARMELPLLPQQNYLKEMPALLRYWELHPTYLDPTRNRPVLRPDRDHPLEAHIRIHIPGVPTPIIQVSQHFPETGGWLQLSLRADTAPLLIQPFAPPVLPPFSSECSGVTGVVDTERLRHAIAGAGLTQLEAANLMGVTERNLRYWLNKGTLPERHRGVAHAVMRYAEGLPPIQPVTAGELAEAINAIHLTHAQIGKLTNLSGDRISEYVGGKSAIPPGNQWTLRALVDWVNDTRGLGPLRQGVMVPRGSDQLPVPVPTRVEVNPMPGSTSLGRVPLTTPVTSADPRRVELGSAPGVTQPGRVELEITTRRGGLEVDPRRSAANFAQRPRR